jgi:hypothetical protein
VEKRVTRKGGMMEERSSRVRATCKAVRCVDSSRSECEKREKAERIGSINVYVRVCEEWFGFVCGRGGGEVLDAL